MPETQLDRIERNLALVLSVVSTLLRSLVDEEDQPERTLDGEEAGGERDQNEGL